MILPFHNWKDKLKNLVSKYPKTFIGFGVLVLAMVIFVGWTQAASAISMKEVGDAVGAFFISLLNAILYYVFLVPIFWLVAVVIQVMVEVASWQLFINEPAVIAGWTIARDLVNVGFIAVLLYIAFGTVISYQKVNWQKDLIKLITAVVLVNFSRMIVGILIDVSQVIMLTFVNGFRNIAGGNITGNLGLDWYLNGTNKVAGTISEASGNFIRLAIGIAMGVLLLSILAMLTAWLLLRIVKLWILTVMAPFYFLADFFPFLKRFHSYWEKEFTDQLVAGPFMAFGIWFAMSVISQTGQSSAITTPRGVLADASALTTTVTDGSVAKQSNAIFTMIIGAGLLYGVYDMSKSMAGAAAKVGQTVFKKSQDYIKAGVMTAGKYADIGLARASKKVLKHDLSVGGARDYVKEMKASWGAKVEAFKMRGDVNLAKYREGKRMDTDRDSSPIWNNAKKDLAVGQAEKGVLTSKMKEGAKFIKEGEVKTALSDNIQKRLLESQGKGTEAEARKNNIMAAMAQAKSGNLAPLKSLMADGAYNFPADLKDKVAKYESISGKFGQGQTAIDDLYGKSLANGGVIAASDLTALVSSGVLTTEEASRLAGKNINNLAKEDPMISEKLNNFQSLAKDVASGVGIDANKAAALGLKGDDFDIFKGLQNAQNNEDEIITGAKRAESALGQWSQGKLSEQDARDLGLSTSEQELVSKQSLADLASLKTAIEQKKNEQNQTKTQIDAAQAIIDDAEKRMKKVKRDLKENYLKSTSTRAMQSRIKKGRDIMLKDQESRYPNHETPEDLAEIFVNVKDPEARDFAINKLQDDDVSEFLKNVGSSADVYGIYESALRIANKLNDSVDIDGEKVGMKDLLDKARDAGSQLDPKTETVLMQSLNGSLSDPYTKEIVQKLVKKTRKEIPGSKHLLKVDKITGNVEFMPFKDRREKDFQALSRGEMQTGKYDGFAHENKDGEIILDDVGYNYFKTNFGRVNKYNLNNFEAHYIQALVNEKKTILEKIGKGNPNHEAVKEALAELEVRTYQQKTKAESDFEEFKKSQPNS